MRTRSITKHYSLTESSIRTIAPKKCSLAKNMKLRKKLHKNLNQQKQRMRNKKVIFVQRWENLLINTSEAKRPIGGGHCQRCTDCNYLLLNSIIFWVKSSPGSIHLQSRGAGVYVPMSSNYRKNAPRPQFVTLKYPVMIGNCESSAWEFQKNRSYKLGAKTAKCKLRCVEREKKIGELCPFCAGACRVVMAV